MSDYYYVDPIDRRSGWDCPGCRREVADEVTDHVLHCPELADLEEIESGVIEDDDPGAVVERLGAD